MGAGRRNTFQGQAQTAAKTAADTSQVGASQTQTNLGANQNLINPSLGPAIGQTASTASNLALTGGYNPVTSSTVDLAGRGRDTYQNLADTGGFTPEQKQQYLQSATQPVQAVYNNAQDQLNRQKSLQGGYSPGFDASTAAITREAAGVGSEANVNAESNLTQQINANKAIGAGGLASTMASATGQGIQQAGLQQQGLIAGQDALQRFSQFGESAITNDDIIGIQNRAQSGQITMADAQLLSTLAAQSPTLFSQIMQGIQGVGGAAAGVLTGIGSL